MDFDAYIFDLDGTLLDTLPDLTALTNTVLAEQGMPVHTQEEIGSYVGSGVRMLIKRAAPADTPEQTIDSLFERWKELHPSLGHKNTLPYEGIPELLAQLKGEGAKLAVLSNKLHEPTCEIIGAHFPGVFDIVRGDSPGTPRKPDPTGLLTMMDDLGVEPHRCAYVGDSGSDMQVALRAGATPIGVAWGYRSVEELRDSGAARLADKPIDIA